MSRSGYTEYWDDDLKLGRWRGQVMSAIRGRRGQKFLKDLLQALDEMPDKALITKELEDGAGDEVFDIVFQLVCEIAYMILGS